MADYFYGEISIGGEIKSKDTLDLIVQQMQDADSNSKQVEILDDIKSAIEQKEHLVIEDPQAKGGQFEKLEKFLMSENLNFFRHSDQAYEYEEDNILVLHGNRHMIQYAVDSEPMLPEQAVIENFQNGTLAQYLEKNSVTDKLNDFNKNHYLTATPEVIKYLDALIQEEHASVTPG